MNIIPIIRCKDIDRSITFYTQVLDFTVMDMYQDEQVRLTFLTLGGLVVELIQYMEPPKEERGKGVVDHIAFTVENLETALAKVKDAGAAFLFSEPKTVNGKRIFFFAGPDGERLEFCQVPAE